MQNYELLYILPAKFADTEIDGLRAKVAGMIEAAGAKVTRNESLGKIKLAYVIKKQQHGTYVLVHFSAETPVIAVLDRQFRLSDEILRHMIVDLVPSQEKAVVQIQSYVAPLSEEARELPRRPSTGSGSATSTTPRAAAPAATEAVAARAADVAPSMSMAELDKKLDEILDAEVEA